MKKLNVKLSRPGGEALVVGVLAENKRRTFFEYDPEFLKTGIELSPFKLPAISGLIEHKDYQFGQLPGLFADSLPDYWGKILMDRHFETAGLDPNQMSALDRLAYLGSRTMGALTYHPHRKYEASKTYLDLGKLGKNAAKILDGQADEVLDELIQSGVSPGGARPKVLVGVKGDRVISGEDELPDGFEHWMIKFPANGDPAKSGVQEQAYALMAKCAGLKVSETRLFRAGRSQTFFGTKRFDRMAHNRRMHVHTFGSLIHINMQPYVYTYETFLATVRALTQNHDDVLRAVRMMTFNIASHNRDDHAKNFAFMLDDKDQWKLAPAYDLCLMKGPGGQHCMPVDGEGENPRREHVLAAVQKYGVSKKETEQMIDQVNTAIEMWPKFADEAGCSKKQIATVKKSLTLL